MERPITSRLSMAHWLDAIWEPGAKINALPGSLDMIDVTGDGEARLIVGDLGTEPLDTAKLKVFKGGDKITEHSMLEPPCGVVGFYCENNEQKSAAVAVAAGNCVFIYKNMRPHFKYCLPYLDCHSKEREIWYNAGIDIDLNVTTLYTELESLYKELGAAFISPRTLKFLSINDEHHRVEFTNKYKNDPLTRINAISTISTIRKDSWNDPASSCILIGTESGELIVLDTRSFSMTDRCFIGWPPCSMTSTGLWSGDGRIFIVSRDTRIGSIKKGQSEINLWEKLLAPAVAITTLSCDGAAVAIMDGTIIGYSNNGLKLWKIKLPGLALDMTSLPVQQSGLLLLAVSVPRIGLLVYDGQHHVDTISMMDPISAIKFGRMGQEERAMAMITMSGGLSVKILKRTANFSSRSISATAINETNTTRFSVPKKTRLFVEQTIRERSEAKQIHSSFQQAFLRLRLTVAKKTQQVLKNNKNLNVNTITIENSVLGLGPTYIIRTLVTNVAEETTESSLFLVFKSIECYINPRVVDLPLLPSGIPIPVMVKATPKSQVNEKIQILLCKKNQIQPITTTHLILPISEVDIEV